MRGECCLEGTFASLFEPRPPTREMCAAPASGCVAWRWVATQLRGLGGQAWPTLGAVRRLGGGWRGPPGLALISGSSGAGDRAPGIGWPALGLLAPGLVGGPDSLGRWPDRAGGGAACIAWFRLALFGPLEDFGPCIGVLPLLVGLLEVAEDTLEEMVV
ncbi:hypothetical protein NDU88_007113 [Pleurodeles waltl]|uniref:Uncharacterized protein n=1 Tax=Pleurodeles waltl TaxID=8319 RepID=A0AAV7VRV2_PLEWA|nr:hypothetical protein NDU88_007113 [Pleurodeles waltl]